MFSTDDVLARLGLQTRSTAGDYLLPLLGVFGTGVLVGAGVALLLAPKSGAMLREDISRKAMDIKEKAMDIKEKVKERMPRGRMRDLVAGAGNMVDDIMGDDDLENMSREELYQRATEHNIPQRSQMSKTELIEALRTS